jgi:hypothetical protein
MNQIATKSRRVKQGGFRLHQTRAPTRFVVLQRHKALLKFQREILKEPLKVSCRRITVMFAVVDGLSMQIEARAANFLDVPTFQNVITREISSVRNTSAVMAIREPPQTLHLIQMRVGAV